MEKITLNVVFIIALVLKTVSVAGAENEVGFVSSALVASNKVSGISINNGDSETDEDDSDSDREEVEAKTSTTRIQNIVMAPASQEASPNQSNSNQLSASMRENRGGSSPISIIPMAGSTGYQGNWNAHVKNSYSLGVALEISTGSLLAIELEGGYGNYTVTYLNFGHDFNKYDFGGNAKFYLMQGVFQPFVGAGVMGIHYENMAHYYNSGYGLVARRYSETIGAGQLIAGGDLALSSSVALGVRASYLIPLFNRPGVRHDGVYAYPNYEDASLINSAHYRLMGALKFSL